MTVLLAFVVGFFLGLRHATDADHLVAIGTLLRRSDGLRGAVLTGAVWGVGHSVTVLAVGTAIVLFGLAMPAGAIPLTELAVGAMLFALGLANLVRKPRGGHGHEHPRPKSRRHLLRPMAVGIIHGLAGSAAVALLALTTIPTRGLALVYLALFGVGTVAGMMLLTTLLALPMRYASKSRDVEAWIVRVASVMSVGLGVWIAAQTLFGLRGE